MAGVDFDDVLVRVGERGRYQLLMYYLLCIPATIPAAFLAFTQVFVSAVPDHWCRVPALDALGVPPERQRALAIPRAAADRPSPAGPDAAPAPGFAKCLAYDVNFTALLLAAPAPAPEGALPAANASWPTAPCAHGWNYDHRDYDSTLVTKFNLVCEDGWWPSTSTTFFYVGSLFGNVLFGWIADRWGRRFSFFLIIFIEVPLSILTAFSPNYVIYTVLRTINGLFFPAIYQIPFILALELMGPRYRTFAGMVICMFFALGMSLLALLGYLLRNWFSLCLATSVPFVLLFSYYWIIPESPRWLLSKNRIDEAEVIVQKMAKFNGKKIPKNFLRSMEAESNKNMLNADQINDKNTSATPMDILRYPNIRKKFFILAFDWIANAVVYNGLSYNTTNLGVSDYLAFFIGGAVEIPSYIITWYAMDRWGRRWVLCLTMLLGGMACVSCMFVPEHPVWVTVSLAMIGKFGIAASFAVFYVFVGELLPTVIRSQAMGIASFIAGIGLLGFPYIVYLAVYNRVLPLIIMGSLSVAGAIASIFLPETLNIHLPQTLEEGEAFGVDFKLFSYPKPRSQHHSDVNYTASQKMVNGMIEVVENENSECPRDQTTTPVSS